MLTIFNENKIALGSTLLLFFVMIYIFSFYAFMSFKDNYKAGDDYLDFNLYCTTLIDCLMSTANYGVRAGGGIGDVLYQPLKTDPEWTERWVIDFAFFMIINIILMNIFFGIIIDSFAEKRAKQAEIEEEVNDNCFICSINKATFEIENENWKKHIFQEHNLHSYLAFMIYVKTKNAAECTGVEKWVKHCQTKGLISFFPINRCLAIRNGESIGEQ